MLQRKQTVYLFLSIILTVLSLSFPIGTYNQDGLTVGTMMNLWVLTSQGAHDFVVWPLFVIQLVTLPMAVVAIFAYRNRIFQSRLCVLNILLLIGWYIVFIVYSLVFKARYNAEFQYSYLCVLPFASIISYIMARRGIKADEKLIRDSDRIR